jgi:hypothetical protein
VVLVELLPERLDEVDVSLIGFGICNRRRVDTFGLITDASGI